MQEKAVIYARYSSNNQTENSIDGQLAAGHAYAESHGYEIIHEYIDRAKTGTNDQREAFQEMLHDCRSHRFSVIIVWKVDRFGRNREEITFNKYKCKKEGVRVEYVAEQLGEGNESIILESVLEGMAEYYSKQLSENVRRGLKAAREKGLWTFGSTRLGYKVVDKRLAVDEQGAEVVRTIFQSYAKGFTMPQISVMTGETVARISNVLHDPKFIGENGGIRIVDDELWESCQKRINSHKRRRTKDVMAQDFILTSKLYCGCCGKHMIGHSTDRFKNNYYRCANTRYGQVTCHLKYLRKDEAEEAILDAVKSVLESPEAIDELVEQVYTKYQSKGATMDDKMALERLRTAEKGIENIMRAVEQGMDYNLVRERLEALQRDKESALEEVRRCHSGVRKNLSKDMIRLYLSEGKNIKNDRELIDWYVDKITYDGEEYIVSMNVCSDVRLNSQTPWILRIKTKRGEKI